MDLIADLRIHDLWHWDLSSVWGLVELLIYVVILLQMQVIVLGEIGDLISGFAC